MRRLTYLGLCFLIIVLHSHTSHSQIPFGIQIDTDVTNQYVLNGPRTLTACPDKSIVIGGSTFGALDYDQRFYLSKIDSTGSVLWARSYLLDSIGQTGLVKIFPLSDSGFFCLGGTRKPYEEDYNVFIVKLDKNGKSLLIKTYKLISSSHLINAEYQDGYIYAVGGVNHNVDYYGFYIVKFNLSGELVAYKSFCTSTPIRDINPQQFLIDNNKNLVISGEVNPLGDSAFIAVVDTLLNIKFSKALWHDNAWLSADNVKQLQNGDYILGGRLLFKTHASYNRIPAYLVRIDSTGQIIWANNYDNYDIPFGYSFNKNQIQISSTDDIWVATGGIGFLALIKSDSYGDTISTHYYQGSYPNDFTLVDDNPVMTMQAASTTMDFNAIILKTDTNGYFECNRLSKTSTITPDTLFSSNSFNFTTTYYDSSYQIASVITDSIFTIPAEDYCLYTANKEVTQEENNITVFPNPFYDYLNVHAGINEQYEIIIYDISFRELVQQKFRGSVSINTGSLSPGIYIYRVHYNNKIKINGKIIKM